MKGIFINIQGKIPSFNKVYKLLFIDLINKYDIIIYNFYVPGDVKETEIDILIREGINMINYKNEKQITRFIDQLIISKSNIYINTLVEDIIPLVNTIKKNLGQKVTKNPELYRNKILQRELMLKNNPKIATKYKRIDLKSTNFESIKNEFGIPFVIKPSNGVQSAGVSIIKGIEDFQIYINNLDDLLKVMSENLNISNSEMLVEEYIDGEKYSIDYFVNQEGEINGITSPILVHSADVVGIDDLFEYMSIASKEISSAINKEELHSFITETISATKIMNTFIHHEFKITTSGKFKTIELNGRIGGYRPEMYLESSDTNLFSFMFENKGTIEVKEDFIVILLYPEREGFLESFNEDILQKIKELDTFFSMNIFRNKIGNKIGLTKMGYKKVGLFKFKSKNFSKLKEDMLFLGNNYKKIIILK